MNKKYREESKLIEAKSMGMLKGFLIGTIFAIVVSSVALANDCVKNTEAYLKSDKMAAISIIEKTGHITVYVDNYNPVQKKFRNIGFYGWNKDMANSLIESGCVSPVFIPLYAHDGSVKFVAEAIDMSNVEFMWRHK